MTSVTLVGVHFWAQAHGGIAQVEVSALFRCTFHDPPTPAEVSEVRWDLARVVRLAAEDLGPMSYLSNTVRGLVLDGLARWRAHDALPGVEVGLDRFELGPPVYPVDEDEYSEA